MCLSLTVDDELHGGHGRHAHPVVRRAQVDAGISPLQPVKRETIGLLSAGARIA